MQAFVFAGCGAVLALLLLAKGLWLWLGERRRMKRLVPAEGRVTRQGRQSTTVYSEDANGNRTQRLDTDYDATYEYRVGTQKFVNTVHGTVPPFPERQSVPFDVIVFYDRDDPTVSRVSDRRGDRTGPAYIAFAGVVLAVSALIALIPHLELILPAPAE